MTLGLWISASIGMTVSCAKVTKENQGMTRTKKEEELRTGQAFDKTS